MWNLIRYTIISVQMWFWIIAQPPFFFSRASSCLGTWLRIWSNSSQVEEKNGSFASLLNGTRPETSKVRTRTFWEQKSKSIVFSSPLCGRMGAWFMVQIVFCLVQTDMWLMVVEVPTAQVVSGLLQPALVLPVAQSPTNWGDIPTKSWSPRSFKLGGSSVQSYNLHIVKV